MDRSERPKAFADLWDRKGTPRPPTTVANPLGGIRSDVRPLSRDEVEAARGIDRSGGIDLSPDGREVAFAWERDGDLEIYTAPLFGDRIIQLTDDGGQSRAPRWSPDGHWVAFVREHDGRTALCVVDRDGAHARALTAGDPLHGAVALSPQGIPQWSEDTASPLLSVSGTPFVAGSPRWSPDRSTIAFTTPARGTTKIAFAYVRDGQVERVKVLDATPFEDSDPVWRPDGRGVVYRRHEHGNVTLHRVFTISHADDAVLDAPGWLFSPRIGPDSETVVAILVDRLGADVVVRPKGGITLLRITRPGGASR